MSKTYKKKPYHPYSKEDSYNRRISRRSFRTKWRQALRNGNFDILPIFKGTEGWLTW